MKAKLLLIAGISSTMALTNYAYASNPANQKKLVHQELKRKTAQEKEKQRAKIAAEAQASQNNSPAAIKAQIAELQARLKSMNNSANQPRAQKDWTKYVSITGLVNVDGSYWSKPNFGQGTHDTKASTYLSLATANLAADAHYGDWVSGRLSLLYMNGGSPSVRHYNPAQSPNRSVKVDQAYLTIANFKKMPYFFQAGQEYLPFGHYERYPITQTLPQVLSQTDLPTAQLGFVTTNGFTGSVYAFSGENKFGHSNRTSINNGGFTIGYQKMTQPLGFDIGGGYIMNIADVDSIRHVIKDNRGYTTSVGGISAYADLYTGPFGFGARYTGATRKFNIRDYAYNESRTVRRGAQPTAGDIFADYSFKTYGHNSMFKLAYQWSSEAHNSATGVALDDATRLPKKRFSATYGVNLFKHLAAALQYYRDYDYSRNHGGTGRTNNVVTLRMSLMM